MSETKTPCARWVNDEANGNKRRCGMTAVAKVVPHEAPSYAWDACQAHADYMVAKGHVGIMPLLPMTDAQIDEWITTGRVS